uniref:Eukaryotic translation initiation factor 5B n=1 Tax=Panagrellus redivivus TaxID=6233 RepID=A0A7E4UU96_PANRE
MASKKRNNKKKVDDWADDEPSVPTSLAEPKKDSESEQSEEEEEEEVPAAPARKAKFAFLADSDEEKAPSDNDNSEPEPEPEPKPKSKPEPVKEKPKPAAEPAEKKDKKKKKKKNAADDEDEDFDAIVAALAKKDKEAKKEKKNKKKKGKATEEDEVPVVEETVAAPPAPEIEAKDEDAEGEGEEGEGGGAVLDEAEEAKRKKRAEKRKKKKEKEKEAAKEGSAAPEAPAQKEKKEEEPKKPRNKKIAALLEAQRLREEEEALQKQLIEEEKKRIEEEEKRLEEEARLQAAKKEQTKKQREAEIAAQKAAGTYRTPAQIRQAQIALERLRSSGHVLPDRDPAAAPTKRPNYGKPKKGKQQPKAAAKPEESAPATPTPPPVEEVAPEPAVEEPAAEPTEVLDDWEIMADEPEPEPEKPAAKKATPAATADGGDPDDDDDDDDSSSDEESDEEDESSDSSSESSDDDEDVAVKIHKRIAKRRAAAMASRNFDVLRSPVICVLGHVDTGKTKMLDTIRRTNVQLGEAGGITQQIGATRVPAEALKERCRKARNFDPDSVKIPGFLIIDTPGHESFANLRSRGSSLCDVAILVVDIMHGLEPQTIESLKLLLKRGTPFVVALNKVDRLYGYESNPQKDIYQHLKAQSSNVQLEFKERYEKIVTEFAENSVNVALSNQNKNTDEYVSIVPTSAFLGDGIGNLLAYIVDYSQDKLAERLAFCTELDCTVMEVRSLPGLGTTVDVILLNGTLKRGDIIVLTGTEGPICSEIRDLLMPAPLREIRVKGDYEHYASIQGAQGVKVLAKGLDNVVAGLPLFVCRRSDELEVLKADAQKQLEKALTSIKKKPEGVYVQASTLGSLEALLEFLKSQKIPYSNVNIGPVHKKDVQKAAAMLDRNAEFACILAFDVPVDRDVQQFADRENVRIFQANIIYHLQDNFINYREELRLKRRRDNEHLAIFPCRLRIMPQNVFNARNPIVCGVTIVKGQLKKGTPICVPSKEKLFIGTISSIERNHEVVDLAKSGEEVCIKIENTTGEAPKLYGRHFTDKDDLVSRITRESIDVCKTHFRDDLGQQDWQLIVELKKELGIL